MALMTSLKGQSVLQETIFENRFRYTEQLNHLKARIKIETLSSLQAPEANHSSEPSHPDQDKHPNQASLSHESNHPNPKGQVFNKAIIQGPVQLYGNKVTATDLRAGAGLIIAALMAKGETKLYGLNHIQRGYENFTEKLKNLKAKIQLINPK